MPHNMVTERLAVMTHREIAERMGDITTSGVAKLEESAFRKLRRNAQAYRIFLMSLELRARRSNGLGTLTEDEKGGDWDGTQ